jgi:hypothetical protein
VVWNDALAKSRELYAAGEKTSYPVLAKLCITRAKQIPERSWLSGPSNVVRSSSPYATWIRRSATGGPA